jgi:hypothetical protein
MKKVRWRPWQIARTGVMKGAIGIVARGAFERNLATVVRNKTFIFWEV